MPVISTDATPTGLELRLTVASTAALRVPLDVEITMVRTFEPVPATFALKTSGPPAAGVVIKAGRFSKAVAGAEAELPSADTEIDAVVAPETAIVPAPATRICPPAK